jgi:hypothetical protein
MTMVTHFGALTQIAVLLLLQGLARPLLCAEMGGNKRRHLDLPPVTACLAFHTTELGKIHERNKRTLENVYSFTVAVRNGRQYEKALGLGTDKIPTKESLDTFITSIGNFELNKDAEAAVEVLKANNPGLEADALAALAESYIKETLTQECSTFVGSLAGIFEDKDCDFTTLSQRPTHMPEDVFKDSLDDFFNRATNYYICEKFVESDKTSLVRKVVELLERTAATRAHQRTSHESNAKVLLHNVL